MRVVALLGSVALTLPVLLGNTGVELDDGCRLLDETDETSAVLCEAALHMQCPADDAEKLHSPTTHVPLRVGAPDRSVTEGAGCGTIDEPVFGSTSMSADPYEYSASGVFQGNVDTATFELHFLGAGVGQLDETVVLDTRITIDDQSLFGADEVVDVTGEVHRSPIRLSIEPEVVQSDTGASVALRFTVTGIAEFVSTALDGEDELHSIVVNFNTPHTGHCEGLPPSGTARCAPAGGYGLVWGTTEVPSNVTFNLEDAEAFGTEIVAENKAGS